MVDEKPPPLSPEHAQAIVALPTGSLRTNAPTDYWLVRFAMGASAEDAR